MFMLDLSENIEIANEGYIPIDLIKLASVTMDSEKIAEEWSKFNGVIEISSDYSPISASKSL